MDELINDDPQEAGRPTLHFSQSNPIDDRPSDLCLLLIRMADEIERDDISSDDVVAFTVSQEIESFGPRWTAAVYWNPSSPDEDL